MNDLDIVDIGTWIYENKDNIFSFMVYRRLPSSINDFEFTNNHVEKAKITNAIEIPNDVLLEFTIIDINPRKGIVETGAKEYHRLSDVNIFLLDMDNESVELLEDDYDGYIADEMHGRKMLEDV